MVVLFLVEGFGDFLSLNGAAFITTRGRVVFIKPHPEEGFCVLSSRVQRLLGPPHL